MSRVRYVVKRWLELGLYGLAAVFVGYLLVSTVHVGLPKVMATLPGPATAYTALISDRGSSPCSPPNSYVCNFQTGVIDLCAGDGTYTATTALCSSGAAGLSAQSIWPTVPGTAAGQLAFGTDLTGTKAFGDTSWPFEWNGTSWQGMDAPMFTVYQSVADLPTCPASQIGGVAATVLSTISGFDLYACQAGTWSGPQANFPVNEASDAQIMVWLQSGPAGAWNSVTMHGDATIDDTGNVTISGAVGPTGATGAPGAAGAVGATGATGSTGLVGTCSGDVSSCITTGGDTSFSFATTQSFQEITAPVNISTGAGFPLDLLGGTATTLGQNGGDVNITSGSGDGAGSSPGVISIQPAVNPFGHGAPAGIGGGSSSVSGQNGGDLTLTGGDSGGGGGVNGQVVIGAGGTSEIMLEAPVSIPVSQNSFHCHLNGGAPATCTAAVLAGCNPVCGYGSAPNVATALWCAVSGTTLTATDTATASATVNFLCL